jgi:hypothetical protein
MTAVDDFTSHSEAPSPLRNARGRASERSVLLAVAGVTGMLAVVAGAVAAYLVCPEPTMWRVPVNGLVMALAVLPIRAVVRRAPASTGRAPLAEAEPEI